MTAADIQKIIFEQTGIKTSVKKLTGSMKNHLAFSPMFQNGSYPTFPVEWAREFIKQFKTLPDIGNYFSSTVIDILKINIEDGEPIKYKKESKPKPISEQSVRQWGSKNSQLRLDKACSRYAKNLRKNDGRARYY